MRICILAAGAGGMYCGSCLRDNALAGALRRAGHDVTLVPLYTPLRTDGKDETIHRVFYGGVNAYLQYATRFFRRTPRIVDWLLDRPTLLKLAGRFGSQTSPAKLGAFTLSILEGERGPQIKELRRLLGFLQSDIRPDIVSLPNLMFVGTARLLRDELRVPIVCELTGEDIFLDAMAEPFRSAAHRMIRERTAGVTRFVATSEYYAIRMAAYLAVPRDRISVVYPGISQADIVQARAPRRSDAPLTIGYFARICPEKGLDRLIDAWMILRNMPGMERVHLRAGGYLGAAHRQWYEALQHRIAQAGLSNDYEYVGEVDHMGKLALLDYVDVFCVPTAHAEPKGMYVLEAMARGVPVVLPSHGAFPELVAQSGAGQLAPPGEPHALAEQLAHLLADRTLRIIMGDRGRQAVRQRFTDDHMAAKMLDVYHRVMK